MRMIILGCNKNFNLFEQKKKKKKLHLATTRCSSATRGRCKENICYVIGQNQRVGRRAQCDISPLNSQAKWRFNSVVCLVIWRPLVLFRGQRGHISSVDERGPSEASASLPHWQTESPSEACSYLPMLSPLFIHFSVGIFFWHLILGRWLLGFGNCFFLCVCDWLSAHRAQESSWWPPLHSFNLPVRNECLSAGEPPCPAPASAWLHLKWCILSYWSFLVESRGGLSGSPRPVCLLNGHTERAVCWCQTPVFCVVGGILWLSGHCGSLPRPFYPLWVNN